MVLGLYEKSFTSARSGIAVQAPLLEGAFLSFQGTIFSICLSMDLYILFESLLDPLS